MNSLLSIFSEGIRQAGVAPAAIAVASDIPFAPEETRAIGIDFFHVPRGRAIAFASGLKLANPGLSAAAIVGDLMTIGGNHFVHASRRNMDLAVVCVNNFVYRRIADQPAPGVVPAFSPYSTVEEPFNIPHLGNSCGAVYTARWTLLHNDDLARSVADALRKRGLSLVEVIAPGLDYYSGDNSKMLGLVQFYHVNSVTKHGEDPRQVGIRADQPIIVGRFTDKERPTFFDVYNTQLGKTLGAKFSPYGKTQ